MAVDLAKVAGMLPEQMVSGGLLDDVDARIEKVRFVPWDYNGSIPNHILAVRVDYQPLDAQGKNDGEIYEQHYSAGDLEHYVPSMDGENPAPGLEHFGEQGNDDSTAEGVYALRVGKKEGLSNTSNWAQYLVAALDAKFPKDRFSAAVSFLEGALVHVNRVPQKKRAGLVKAEPATGDKKRNNDILVITEFKGFASSGKSSGGSRSTSSPAPTSPASSSAPTPPTTAGTQAAGGSVSDLDAALIGLVKAAVAAAGDEGLSKTKLPSVVLAKAPAALKGKGVKRVAEAEFLGAHDDQWAYDPDSGTLYNV